MATSLPLAHSVYDRLKEKIVMGHLKPGTSLQEVQLAEMFEVSRTPIREALRMLTREGLVELLPRQGAYVSALSIKDVLEACEVRYYLEPPAARKAAQKVTLDVLQRMNFLLETHLEQPTSFEEGVAAERADVEFHNHILTLGGNLLVQKIIQDVRQKTQRLAFYTPPGRFRQVCEEHRAIMDALQARDGDLAEARMRDHIQHVRLAGLEFVTT